MSACECTETGFSKKICRLPMDKPLKEEQIKIETMIERCRNKVEWKREAAKERWHAFTQTQTLNMR